MSIEEEEASVLKRDTLILKVGAGKERSIKVSPPSQIQMTPELGMIIFSASI